MKPCPFCGKTPDLNDPDTLYPNGTGWRDHHDNTRSYHHFHQVPQTQWCYSVHCVTTSGGCGSEVSGDTREEATKKWNTRVTDVFKQVANEWLDKTDWVQQSARPHELGMHRADILQQRIDILQKAIASTLRVNAHLADGEVATLKTLKDAYDATTR